MNTDNEEQFYELSPLGLQYRAELPRILRLSDSDLEAAIAALDRYLEQAPPPAFQKALLTWKGRFYNEHQRYDDAIRELRSADTLQCSAEIANFNTKSDLALALEKKGEAVEAYSILIKALNETADPHLHHYLLPDLARLSLKINQALPEGAELMLEQIKHSYGMTDSDALADLPAEILRVTALIKEASIHDDDLERALRTMDNANEKLALIDTYLQDVKVPYYKKLAYDLRERIAKGES